MKGEWNSTADRRRRILQAARDEFARNGYGAASVRQIARQCDLHQPSVYHLFGGKEQLFRAVMAASHQQLLDYLETHVRRGGSLKQEIHSVFDCLAAYQRKDASYMFLMFTLIFAAPPEIQTEYSEILARDYFRLLKGAFDRRDLRDPERLGLLNDVLRAFLLDLAAPAIRKGKSISKKAGIDFILAGMPGA